MMIDCLGRQLPTFLPASLADFVWNIVLLKLKGQLIFVMAHVKVA